MASGTLASPNYTFHALAAGYFLAFIPAGYTMLRIRGATGGYDNAMPRQALDRLQGKITQDTWDECHRALCAHRNGMENFSLYAAAALAGNIARLPAARLNAFAISYLAVRLAYTVAYIWTPAKYIGLSYFRSGLWAYGCGLCIWTLLQAGQSLA